jgi:hypothetical protein
MYTCWCSRRGFLFRVVRASNIEKIRTDLDRSIVAALLAFVCTRAWLFLRRHGYEAGAEPAEEVRERMESKVSVEKYEGYPPAV